MNDNFTAGINFFAPINEGPPAKPLMEFVTGTMAKTTDHQAKNRIVNLLNDARNGSPAGDDIMFSMPDMAKLIGLSSTATRRGIEQIHVEPERVRGWGEKKRKFFSLKQAEYIMTEYGLTKHEIDERLTAFILQHEDKRRA